MGLIKQQQKLLLLTLTILTLSSGKKQLFAQTPISQCQPPNPGEYLLLVITATETSQTQLRNVLPSQLNTTICQYQGDMVTRIGNFRLLEDANRWGQYLQSSLQLSPIIIRSSVNTSNNTSNNTPTPNFPTYPPYKPQLLAKGYAVLVDYNNRPELAAQIKQILNQDIGLISYRGRPYLLASQNLTQEEGKKVLDILSNRGYWVIMVDSQECILLTPVVHY